MENNNTLFYFVIALTFLSFVSLLVTYRSSSEFNNLVMTGFATENGTVNVTISTVASINITQANGVIGSKGLNWGSGSVEADSAILVSNGTVVGGTWSPVNSGFLVENIGNVNVTLSVSSDVDAAQFIGGTSPEFKFAVSNNESNSCTFDAVVENAYNDLSSTPTSVCSVFRKDDNQDEININIWIKIPSDSFTGNRNSQIILTYEGA
jgi:hypothetical protein